MPTSTLLASGTAAAVSAAVVLSDGEAATLSFVGNGKLILVSVDDAGAEQDAEVLMSTAARMVQVVGPLRFKVRRNTSLRDVGMTMFRGVIS